MRKNTKRFLIALCTIVAFLLLPKAAEAKTIVVEDIVSSTKFCKEIADGDTVIIRSRGGSVRAAWEMVNCLRAVYVETQIETAYSAATFLALAGKDVCVYKNARLGFHSPYQINPLTYEIINISAARLRLLAQITYYSMLAHGHTKQTALYVVGLTFLTPSEKLSVIYYDEIVQLLGSRYRGTCGE